MIDKHQQKKQWKGERESHAFAINKFFPFLLRAKRKFAFSTPSPTTTLHHHHPSWHIIVIKRKKKEKNVEIFF